MEWQFINNTKLKLKTITVPLLNPDPNEEQSARRKTHKLYAKAEKHKQCVEAPRQAVIQH